MSEILNTNPTTLRKLVKGENLPSSKILLALAETGLSINWLLLEEGEMMREPQDKKNISQGSHSVAQIGHDNTARQSNADNADLHLQIANLTKELEHAQEKIALQEQLIKALSK